MTSEASSAGTFPAVWGERAPWRVAGRRGVRWARLTPEQDALFARWVERGRVEAEGGDVVVLKPEVVRVGGLVAKLFDPPAPLRRLGRGRDTARRAAELALAIRPVPSPRPLLAVGGVGPTGARSLLVSEHVDGPSLEEAWERSPPARAALPELLATMHARGVHHGDLHPGNVLWDGRRLSLLDLTALRRGPHLLLARRLERAQWARLVLYLGDVAGLRRAFERYHALRGRRAEQAPRAWSRVLGHARSLAARRAVLPPKAPSWS